MQEKTNSERPVSSGILHHKYDFSRNNFSTGESAGFNFPGQLFNSAPAGKFTGSRSDRDFSQVRLHADEVSNPLTSRGTGLTIQRFSSNGAVCPTCPDVEATQISASAEPTAEATGPALEAIPTPEPSERVEETAPREETARQPLIVEDSATELSPGRMRKSEFLAQLHTEVCRTVEVAIAETGQTTDGCPYIGRWFDFYSRQESAYIERAILRYAPEASNATAARGYISAVTQKARQSAETWARTGEITGVPEGIPIGFPGTGLLGSLVSGIGSIFFKARNGGAGKVVNPRGIRARLGTGQPLESTVRSRMESAFSTDFSHVRTHTDSNAAGLSDSLNARAFTVGKDIAFGSAEYKPGTLVGDALVAHELAHVSQQSGTSTAIEPMEVGGSSYNALEEDADSSAMEALVSLWGGAKGKSAHIARNAIPRLRSGLSLQRCERGSGVTTNTKNKTVTINTTALNGATDNSTSDISTSNSIFSKASCGLQVAAGNQKTLNPGQTTAILAADNKLDEPSGATVSAEEKQLVAYNRSSGRITAYYVPGFKPGKRGTSLQAPRHGVPDSLLMGPSQAIDTFTHELGHILSRDHTHHSDPDNLMASGKIRNVGVDKVTSKQCTNFLTKTSYPI